MRKLDLFCLGYKKNGSQVMKVGFVLGGKTTPPPAASRSRWGCVHRSSLRVQASSAGGGGGGGDGDGCFTECSLAWTVLR